LGALRDWARSLATSGARITVITQDGQVLADSESDPQTMENHAGRPEIQEALARGEGRSIRHSVTINRDLLYYAVRQQSAAGQTYILRFALPRETVDAALWSFRRNLWLASIVILLIAGGITLLVSRGFASRVDRLTAFSSRVAEGNFQPLASDGSE